MKNLFFDITAPIVSIIFVYIIINLVEKFFTQGNHRLENKLNGLFLILLFLLFVEIFFKFWLKIPIDGISITLQILIIFTAILWHVCLFSFKNLMFAKIVAICNVTFVAVNVAYNWDNNKLYLISLIVLGIWEICMAKIVFDLSQRQVLSLEPF